MPGLLVTHHFPLARLILRPHGLCLGHHALDVLAGQAAAVVVDGHLGLGASHLVPRRHHQQAVGADLERDVHLGLPLLGALDALDLKLPEQVVAVGLLPLAFKDADVDLKLKASDSEAQGLMARERRVTDW